VFTVKVLLLECFQYYHNLKLGNDCTQSKSCRVPNHCAQNNAVYNILHYLTDIEFIKQNVSIVSCLALEIKRFSFNFYSYTGHK
jgi:hypothetical protein